MDKGEKEIKQQLGRLIEYYSKTLPDSARVADDLWKFAKKHDRRAYQLLRFAMAVDSDYRKVYKSIVRLTARLIDLSLIRTIERAHEANRGCSGQQCLFVRYADSSNLSDERVAVQQKSCSRNLRVYPDG